LNKKLTIFLVTGARPNFMKIAPLYHVLRKEKNLNVKIVHTGQHYDFNMSDSFMRDFDLPLPHYHLGIGKTTPLGQMGKIMIAFEKVCKKERPHLVIVVGDVNSTLASAIASSKLNLCLAHMEAGLRSFDRTMTEELNRILTDAVADILWTHSKDADDNLLREGISRLRIFRVGNIMIDTLAMMKHKIKSEKLFKDLGLDFKKYGVVTLHRPTNVDSRAKLKNICEMLVELSNKVPLVFPIHPRTKKQLIKFRLLSRLEKAENIHLSEPLPYVKFMNLVINSLFVLTDSGGLQEETTYLQIPCLTLRNNTERPVTLEGTNRLVTPKEIVTSVERIKQGKWHKGKIPELWDGRTSIRVKEHIKKLYNIT